MHVKANSVSIVPTVRKDQTAAGAVYSSCKEAVERGGRDSVGRRQSSDEDAELIARKMRRIHYLVDKACTSLIRDKLLRKVRRVNVEEEVSTGVF